MEKIWKDVAVNIIEVLSPQLPVGTGGSYRHN